MLRVFRTGRKGLSNRFSALARKGLLGIGFGILVFLLIVVGALYSKPYAKKFGRGHLPLEHKYERPHIGIFNEMLCYTNDQSEYSPESRVSADEYEEDNIYSEKVDPASRKRTASMLYPLGADKNGRGILAGLLAGCWTVLQCGVLAVSLTLLLGTTFGILSGYLGRAPVLAFLKKSWPMGGKTSAIASSLSFGELANLVPTLVNIFPRLVLIIIILTLWKEIDIWSVVIAIGIINLPKVSYTIKDKIEHLKNQEFIEAARELGVPHRRIILKHILWYSCRPIILVQMAFVFAEVVLVESSLSYLGYGLPQSWGGMIALERDLILHPSGVYWPFVFPAAAIVVAIIAFNALGDGLSKWFRTRY
jgi:peptide/nickel transport system permease protein